jgi:pre-mRNA-processing factor SLU7
MGHNRK